MTERPPHLSKRNAIRLPRRHNIERRSTTNCALTFRLAGSQPQANPGCDIPAAGASNEMTTCSTDTCRLPDEVNRQPVGVRLLPYARHGPTLSMEYDSLLVTDLRNQACLPPPAEHQASSIDFRNGVGLLGQAWRSSASGVGDGGSGSREEHRGVAAATTHVWRTLPA